MEKMKLENKKNIEIKVQFEFLNKNDILDLSKEYKVKISLDEKTDFEMNKQKILSEANFKTPKERENYHMFDKAKKKFLIKNSDFEPYIKTKSPIILINCYEYSDKTIEKLNEEINIFSNKSKNSNLNEIKRKEFINELACLENNLEVDSFADEFIFKNGMKILLTIIKDYFGDVRKYALKGILKLLSFVSVIEFFTKNEKHLNILYMAFIGNNEFSNGVFFYDIINKLMGNCQDIITTLINMCDHRFYEKTTKYLEEENNNNDSKNNILLFIVIILNYSNKKQQFELILDITKAGIFDNLKKMIKKNEDIFSEQIELFEKTLGKIMEEIDNKDNKEYEMIKGKFNNFIENKSIYHIQNLILKSNSEDEEIKTKAINELNKMLTENNNNLDLVYEAYMKRDNSEEINLFYNYFILLFEKEKNIFSNFINSFKKYNKNEKIKPLNELLKILTDVKSPNPQLKIDTFSFINKALSTFLKSSNNEDYLELLYILTDNGIFELLENNSFEKEEKLNQESLKFIEIIEKNLSKIEENKMQKYQIIKNNFQKLKEKKIIKEIKELLLKIQSSNSSYLHIEFSTQLISLIENENNFKIFYKLFAENEHNNLYFSFFEIFNQYFLGKDNRIMIFIQIIDEFEKTSKFNGLSKILNYLENDKNEIIQIEALTLINTLLGIQDKKISYKILDKLNKLGIFEYLKKLVKNKEREKETKPHLINFTNFVEKILNSNKKEKNFKVINSKFIDFKELQDLFYSTIDDFIILEKE